MRSALDGSGLSVYMVEICPGVGKAAGLPVTAASISGMASRLAVAY